MGKEWLYWGGGGGSSRSTKRVRSGGGERDSSSSSTSSGCMSAVLHLFDLHHFQFALHQQPSFHSDSVLPEEPTVLKGVEAPRNSLELVEPNMEASSLSSNMKKEENLKILNIPAGIQIKTSSYTRTPRASTSKARTDDFSSECSSSPGAKTPTLVARLMGLDLLPETCSPSLSKSHLHPRSQTQKQSRDLLLGRSSISRGFFDYDSKGTRSLPETPRMSSARRSDVDHHRPSLQINKENTYLCQELEFSGNLARNSARRRDLRLVDNENRSPGQYARQIVKQVKESVSRKVGQDITNTIKDREQGRRDENLVLLKPKKPTIEFRESKQSSPSCSPRLRFLEPKAKPDTPSSTKNQNFLSPKLTSSPLSSSADNQSRTVKVPSKPKAQPPLQEQQKCKKVRSERYGPHFKKPPQSSETIWNKKEEPFVRSSV
ncbi:unnamed protein product [Ilex paraguariensis]|uniref:DUF3741 domain-containing protein n=1 Tax=Ilex paraguariensis TaxID=185542 RepID=A0ABC8QR69_9AQUA